MKSTATHLISYLLMVTTLALPFQAANAGMISASNVLTTADSSSQRATVTTALQRNETIAALSAHGVAPMSAEARVASMTDAEVAVLAGRIQAAPAGADGGIIALILVVFLIWLVVQRR